MSPRVSVVVPTYRRPDLLRRCLAALLAQDLDADDYEVIIADDDASDGTRRLIGQVCADAGQMAAIFESESVALRSPAPLEHEAGRGLFDLASREMDTGGADDLMAKLDLATAPGELVSMVELATPSGVGPPGRRLPCVRWLPVSGTSGPAGARNAGWRAAAAPVIAFTDDDCIPAPGWLKAGLAAFDAGAGLVLGVSGQIVMPLPLEPTDYELNAAALQRSEFVTANCFYTRAALESVSGFDERFTKAWREDSDLFFTLLEMHNEALIRAPTAIVFHPIRPASWGVSLQQQKKNKFNALLYKKHPALYRCHVQATQPWHYYGIVASALTSLAAGAAGLEALAIGSAGLWALLTGRFLL